ncbi:hypothetical protein Syun_025865 [Stephania yunnanensis]|uniref:Uncharacterized protein n=1 Tax=Stephania yunnanensis TaxID=152371 RepID=A0AAP0HWI9_9MAGN
MFLFKNGRKERARREREGRERREKEKEGREERESDCQRGSSGVELGGRQRRRARRGQRRRARRGRQGSGVSSDLH